MLERDDTEIELSKSMEVNKEFQTIPGIGDSLSKDLVALGYQKINEGGRNNAR
jgi:hypothetical protein